MKFDWKFDWQIPLICITAVLAGAVLLLYREVSALKEAYDSEHPVVVMDWNDISNPQNYKDNNAEAAIDAAYQVAQDLAAAGYIVVDGRAVNRAHPDSRIGSEQIKARLRAGQQ